jgi:hypothetical protein
MKKETEKWYPCSHPGCKNRMLKSGLEKDRFVCYFHRLYHYYLETTSDGKIISTKKE